MGDNTGSRATNTVRDCARATNDYMQHRASTADQRGMYGSGGGRRVSWWEGECVANGCNAVEKGLRSEYAE